MPNTARVEIDSENIATITLDLPNKPVNTLCLAMLTDLKRVLDSDLKAEPKALLLTSAKPKTFIAGADLGEIRALSRDELMKYLELGDEVFSRINAMKCPTVAVINGDTLGGGLEIAMSCRYRVCADVPSIKLGLPETTIGLVPGWAGTVRLPKLVGFEKAIAMLTEGKPVSPKEALELGLVDRVVPMDQLMIAARDLVSGNSGGTSSGGTGVSPVVDAKHRSVAAGNTGGTPMPPEKPEKTKILALLDQVESGIKKKTRDWFPAPLKILDLIKIGLEKGEQAQMKAERVALCDLRDGSVGSNLLRNFFMRTGAKKSAASAFKVEPLAVNSCAVIGGGTMGAGIAHAMLKSGLPVVLIEQNAELASSAQTRVNQMLDDDVAGNRMPANVASDAKSKFISTHDFSKLADADVIIEAVFEDINVKRDTFAKIAQHAKPSAVLASNTSSLSIDEIAQTTKSPAK
ncbi:MAG TPA: enoyl-CoA hydratase-related protein, partial [Tepidisphaeraceae bacterium]|nr:enoyl-CoA hydratase-related protein [Tepidisphaeraceae bacterium]